MSAYISKGAKTAKGRVYDRHGVPHMRTFGTRDVDETRKFEAFLLRMRRTRRWEVLDLIIARNLPIPEAFYADEARSRQQ